MLKVKIFNTATTNTFVSYVIVTLMLYLIGFSAEDETDTICYNFNKTDPQYYIQL